MKKFPIIVISCFLASHVLAQTGNVSHPVSFRIEKDAVPPMLSIVPNSQSFVDRDENGMIDANEPCLIRFDISNDGAGDGYGCVARLNVKGAKDGLSFAENTPLPVIPHGTRQTVEIPVTGREDLQTGEIEFSIVVDEPNGFGTDPITGKIATRRLRAPRVQVVSYKVVGAQGGKLNRRETFKLQILVQNTDQGTADNVTVALKLPDNVSWTGGSEDFTTVGLLKANETRSFEYELLANQRAADQIDIEVALSERTGKFAQNARIPLQFGQYIGSSISMNIESKEEEVVPISLASLVSDVDENIPVTGAENRNTFVLIIANEHYQQVAAVPFALNDGHIFHEYCTRTLGIDKRHIRYIADATGNQIKQVINWLDNITSTWEDAQVIVYYAGHGIPDEANRTAYLLPVDGSGTDVTTGYKLDDLYAVLGNMPATQITVFMDACFSGSKREEGMLASARTVALKVHSGMPQGNMVVFSAAQGDETAYPDREQQHGLFTYYLLKKLKETEGRVSLKDLGDYITLQVSRQSLLMNDKKQTPTVTPSTSVATQWQTWTLR